MPASCHDTYIKDGEERERERERECDVYLCIFLWYVSPNSQKRGIAGFVAGGGCRVVSDRGCGLEGFAEDVARAVVGNVDGGA